MCHHIDQASSGIYDLFGLSVASDLHLDLPRTSGPGQVEVVLGHVPVEGTLLFQTDDPVPFACFRQDDAVLLVWDDVRFRILPGRVVVSAVDLDVAAHLLVPAAWSVVLAAHGRESLHGAAVEHEGHAIAIMGASGSGKTTAAQGLTDRGWRLVSDDLLTLDANLRVVPGPPWMRLLSGDDDAWAGERDVGGKVRVFPPTSSVPVPLETVVIMAPEHQRCVRFEGVPAVAALFQQVYNPVVMYPGQEQRRFDLVYDLVGRVPIYGVPPRSLSPDLLIHLSKEKRA